MRNTIRHKKVCEKEERLMILVPGKAGDKARAEAEQWFQKSVQGSLDFINICKEALRHDRARFMEPPCVIHCTECAVDNPESDVVCRQCGKKFSWKASKRRRMTEVEWAESTVAAEASSKNG